MKRRQFIKNSGILTSGAIIAGAGLHQSCNSTSGKELSKHIVDRVEPREVNFHWPRPVGKNARIGKHGKDIRLTVLQLFTDQGANGWGMARYGSSDKPEELKNLVIGKPVNELIDPSSGILAEDLRAFDIALHDLAGVILNEPVYKMLGNQGPLSNDIYSGMIYFDELEPEDNPAGIEKVLENCRWDYNYGYRQLKVKIGRSGRWYPHDEGLAMDIRIIKEINKEFGGEVEILVDTNDMYSLQDTKDFLKGVEGIPIYWVEEPFPENVEEGRKLRKWMDENERETTFYADGERLPDQEVCMELGREGNMDVYLEDVVGLGFTAWRKLMPSLKEINMLASPHAWGGLMKTHYATQISAGLGNVCTLEGVTCFSDDIDFGDYAVKDGKITVSDDPGFGMKLL